MEFAQQRLAGRWSSNGDRETWHQANASLGVAAGASLIWDYSTAKVMT